jgi:hypothetical protein
MSVAKAARQGVDLIQESSRDDVLLDVKPGALNATDDL